MKPNHIRNQAVEMVRQGTPCKDVAEKLIVSYPIVVVWCRKAGVKCVSRKRGPKNGPRIKLASVVELAKQGKTSKEIAATLGCCTRVVWQRLNAVGVRARMPSRDRAPWIPSVDWSKKDIRIAEEVGVSRERVRQVRKSLGIAPRPRGLPGSL